MRNNRLPVADVNPWIENVNNIPLDYFQKILSIDWCDIRWGFRHNLFNKLDVISYAKSVLDDSVDYGDPRFQISLCSDCSDSDVLEKLNHIPTLEENVANSERKLLYGVLRYLYEHRGSYDKPMFQLELAIEDFNCPKYVEYLMPWYNAGLDNVPAKNFNEPYENWKKYIESEEKVLSIKIST